MVVDGVGLNNYYIIPDLESNNGNFMFAPVRYLREARVDFSLEGAANLVGKAAIITGLALSILALGVGIYLIYKSGQEWSRQETLLDTYKITKNEFKPNSEKQKESGTITEKNKNEEQIKVSSKVLPAEKSKVEELDAKMKSFKKNALESLNTPQIDKPQVNFSLSLGQHNKLKTAYGERTSYKPWSPPEGIRILRNINYVYFLDDIPGFVFKHEDKTRNQEEDLNAANKYIEDVVLAQKCIQDNNLYLLQVPQAQLVIIDDKVFIQQERLNLISGNSRDQKGVYSYCWNDEEMKPYVTELFKQLTIFISKTNFSDVKYDNIPLTVDGKVALIDLDRKSALTGLTKGCARGNNHGLFNLIPLEHIDDFMKVAKDSLDKENFEKLEKELLEIKDKLQKRKINQNKYQEFLKGNSVTSVSQKINPDINTIFKDANMQKLAECVVESINEKLSSVSNFTVNVGRKLFLDVNGNDPLFKSVCKIYENASDRLPPKGRIEAVLKILQEEKFIHQFKFTPYSAVKVVV